MAKLTVEWVAFNDDCKLETRTKTLESSDKSLCFMHLTELIGDLERTAEFCKITSIKEE